MCIHRKLRTVVFATLVVAGAAQAEQPNILVIWGDDVGFGNISAYGLGVAGYRTPNIDRIAEEGMLFTDYYGGTSSTAGRSSYLTGQNVYRTGHADSGLLDAGPGLQREDPTIAVLLREYGYMTGYFGKHQVGDRDTNLPTNHGFDEFLGSLYDHGYGKPPGKRGVIRSFANGRILDSGPLTEERMATLDADTVTAAANFMQRAHEEGKPFYIWWNGARAQSESSDMPEHDRHVGRLLAQLDDLEIADNTIVHYSTDSGPRADGSSEGATSPYSMAALGDGYWRVPSIVRWPGRIATGTISNEIMHHLDWLPTLLIAAGSTDIRDRLGEDGVRAGGRRYKVHLDGYDFLPYLEGSAETGPRREVLFFARTGELIALRYGDWRGTFAALDEQAYRLESPLIINLRLDPYGHAEVVSAAGQGLAGFVAPAEGYLGQFLATFEKFPPRQSTVSYDIEDVLAMLQSVSQPQ